MQEPQPLLGERQRQISVPCRGLQGRRLDSSALSAQVPDVFGQLGHRGLLEQNAQGQLLAEALSHAGSDLGSQQGMAAELEEIVVDTEALESQDPTPDPEQDFRFRRDRLCRNLET